MRSFGGKAGRRSGKEGKGEICKSSGGGGGEIATHDAHNKQQQTPVPDSFEKEKPIKLRHKP